VNDYYESFTGYTVTADVYDLSMRRVFSRQAKVDLRADGVANDLFGIEFPSDISDVHFIRLRLLDEKGKQVGSNFYWRSNSKYEGKGTLTGATTVGFEDINKLAAAKVSVDYKTYMEGNRFLIDLHLRNRGKALSFFTQLLWLDDKGSPVRPSFYSDNFFSLLPNEAADIVIETNPKNLVKGKIYTLVVKGFNLPEQRFNVKF
jgi:mannosylglycoprotein endo-beta-mannosidase